MIAKQRWDFSYSSEHVRGLRNLLSDDLKSKMGRDFSQSSMEVLSIDSPDRAKTKPCFFLLINELDGNHFCQGVGTH